LSTSPARYRITTSSAGLNGEKTTNKSEHLLLGKYKVIVIFGIKISCLTYVCLISKCAALT
jgi:hypothetical protein